MRGSRSTQARAICASVWSRRSAIAFKARTCPTFLLGDRGCAFRKRPGGGATVGGNAVEIAVGQHALRQQREGNAAHALGIKTVEQPVALGPTVEHRMARLVDDGRRAEPPQDRCGFGGLRAA